MNWSAIPDVLAAALLAGAFASVVRRCKTTVSGLWLIGWLMIVLHFIAALFWNLPGFAGNFASLIALASLIWAGALFLIAPIPYRGNRSNLIFSASILICNTAYLAFLIFAPERNWGLAATAVLLAVVPLAIAVHDRRTVSHPLRWFTASVYTALGVVLLFLQQRPNGGELAINGLLFTIYLICAFSFVIVYRRSTAGAFVSIAGFVCWANVFSAAPMLRAWAPWIHMENEVWNLPKYVVAVGMMLLLLEDQVQHNEYLALHDELTGLPNRRLFQDRLANAIERARRNGEQTALMVIDLDRFKLVNDTFGHHIGDLLLEHVAKAFASRVRRSDTVARTGGDEFSIILEEPTSREDACLVGESLMELLKEPVDLEGTTVQTGASIGIAIFPEDALETDKLFISADMRMYEIKNNGRGQLDGRCDSMSVVTEAQSVGVPLRLASE